MTSRISWPSTTTCPVEPLSDVTKAALFDEIIKIAEQTEAEYTPVSHALRSMLVGAAGGAVGYGLADLAGKKLPFFQQPTETRARMAKVILPILSGSAVMLADRYRHKMNEQYRKVKGYEGK